MSQMVELADKDTSTMPFIFRKVEEVNSMAPSINFRPYILHAYNPAYAYKPAYTHGFYPTTQLCLCVCVF